MFLPLSGAVSYLPAAGSGSLWSVRGGNWRLASALLDHSGAKVHMGASVVRVTTFACPEEKEAGGCQGQGGVLYNLTLESGRSTSPLTAMFSNHLDQSLTLICAMMPYFQGRL